MDLKNSVKKLFEEDESWQGVASHTQKKPTIKINYSVPSNSELSVYQSPSGHGNWDSQAWILSGIGSLEVGVVGTHYYLAVQAGADGEVVLNTYLSSAEVLNDTLNVSVKNIQSGGLGNWLFEATIAAQSSSASFPVDDLPNTGFLSISDSSVTDTNPWHLYGGANTTDWIFIGIIPRVVHEDDPLVARATVSLNLRLFKHLLLENTSLTAKEDVIASVLAC